MTSALRERPLTYPVPSEGRWGWCAPPRPSFRTTPSPRLRASPVHWSRTASQTGAEGTKQLLAQYGDRLIRVRYRYDAQRKKRLKTVELVGAEPDWEPQRPPFAQDQIVCVTRRIRRRRYPQHGVKQAGRTWNAERRV